ESGKACGRLLFSRRHAAKPNLRRRVAREGLVTCGNAVWGTEDVARKSQGRRQRDICLGVNGSSRAASAPRRTAPCRQNIKCAVSTSAQVSDQIYRSRSRKFG